MPGGASSGGDGGAGAVIAHVTLEQLYHYRCGACDHWWSIADRAPNSMVWCPDCGVINVVETIENL